MARVLKHKAEIAAWQMLLVFAAVLIGANSLPAQTAASKAAPPACSGDIPTGVRVIRLPADQQHKVAISDFSVSTNKDPDTYNLAMQVKNGTDSWCVTSLGLTYVFGDARGQEWTANEYPAVLSFKAQLDTPPPARKGKAGTPAPPPPSSMGMAPGKEQKRVLFNVYDYIQPHPEGFFDGFHLISAEIKYCMGYSLTESKQGNPNLAQTKN